MKRFAIILLSLIATFSLSSQTQCGLNNFSYEVIPDGDVFYISIDQPINISDNYHVFINDHKVSSTSGKFGPYKADCETFYSLSVFKKEHEECSVMANIGSVCSSDKCTIRDIEFSYPECNPNGVVYITLDFKYENVSDSFYVKGNGNEYGEFAYQDLPIKLGPFPGDCNTKYEFAFRDFENNNCVASIGDIIICCPIDCGPPVFDIVSMECSEEKITMKLELKEGHFGTNLTVKIDEEYVSNFELDGNYLYLTSGLASDILKHTVTVCSVGIIEECCSSKDFSTEECQTSDDCKIYDLHYSYPDCQANEEVFVKLDFKYKNTVSDSFKVRGNGIQYGEYAYADLPVNIGPFQPGCDILYELVIQDSKDESCRLVNESLYICCNEHCLEPIFEVIALDCTDDQLNIKLELIHHVPGDQLTISYNGQVVEDYKIDPPYIYLELPNNGDVHKDLQICTPNSNIQFCCYSQLIDPNLCNPNGDCKIGGIHVSPSACTDATEIPHFKINFDYANVGSKGFSVKGNGHDYGDFKYEDLPITIYALDSCELYYEFVVIDNEFNCSSAVEYGYHCCADNCSFKLSEPRVKCEDGIVTEIAFYLEEETDPIKKYSVYANGQLIGETEKNNVFLEFETEIHLDGVDGIELTVCDDACCVSRMLDVSKCYDDVPECNISNIKLRDLTCGDQGLNFKLSFDHVGTSATFDLYSIYGLYGTFKYAELPLKIENYPALGFGLNAIFICDSGTLCCQIHLFSPPACLVPELGDDGETTAVHAIQTKSDHYIKQNPINNELILISPFANNNYHLYSSAGQRVTSIQSDTKETLIDTSPYTPGLYIVRIENEAGIKIEKLIIAK